MFPQCSQSLESDNHIKDDRDVCFFGLQKTEDLFRGMHLEIVRKTGLEDAFVLIMLLKDGLEDVSKLYLFPRFLGLTSYCHKA